MLEPLHAVYRRGALLDYLEEHESLSLRPMVRSFNTHYVCIEKIREIDPDLLTFTNINNLQDLESIDPQTDLGQDDARGPGQEPS
jgi:molybdopterin-guanine dinucleotide biosynthesis protein A